MKDIVISGRLVRREIIIALSCFLLSFCINVGSVIAYSKPWVEVFTQKGNVFLIAAFIYTIL